MADSVNRSFWSVISAPTRKSPHPGRPGHCQSTRGDEPELARQGDRQASRDDRMAPRGDLQREPRARIAEQYLKKGSKVYLEGSAPDAEMARPDGPGSLLDRSGAARLRAELTMLDGRQRDGTGEGERSRNGGDFGRSGPFPGDASGGGGPPSTRSSTTRSRLNA